MKPVTLTVYVPLFLIRKLSLTPTVAKEFARAFDVIAPPAGVSRLMLLVPAPDKFTFTVPLSCVTTTVSRTVPTESGANVT